MQEEQKKREKVWLLVEESWSVVERDLEAHGVAFFLKIFEIAPAALQLFSFKGEFSVVAHASISNSSLRLDARGIRSSPSEVSILW